MSPERQRAVIAEMCGHKDIAVRIIAKGTGLDTPMLCSGVVGMGGYSIPDYLNDLNAIRQAILELPEELRTEFHRQLYILTRPVPYDMWAHNWAFITAGPGILCKALLRTHDKWEESQ